MVSTRYGKLIRVITNLNSDDDKHNITTRTYGGEKNIYTNM